MKLVFFLIKSKRLFINFYLKKIIKLSNLSLLIFPTGFFLLRLFSSRSESDPLLQGLKCEKTTLIIYKYRAENSHLVNIKIKINLSYQDQN